MKMIMKSTYLGKLHYNDVLKFNPASNFIWKVVDFYPGMKAKLICINHDRIIYVSLFKNVFTLYAD